jgi:hypothetical protein
MIFHDRPFHRYSTLLFLPLFLLCGCMQIQKSSPEKHQFILDVTRPGEQGAERSEAILVVNPFRVFSIYEGKGFKYQKGDLGLDADFYNEFFTQPGAMIAEQRKWSNAMALKFRSVSACEE